MLRNTGSYVTLDEKDWLRARDVHWFEKQGVPVNRLGVSLIECLGLDPLKMVNPEKFDYRFLKGDFFSMPPRTGPIY